MSAEAPSSRPRGPLSVTPARPASYRSWWYFPASVALLAPCYWQPRIEAGDLASHIYNAWLAGEIQNGRAPGLRIAHQATNVLFDLLLSGLYGIVGAAWAQRILVSACVLIFVWGAFSFVSAVSRRPAWEFLPCIAILAYGWVYHMGLFNFYLALGLCFWALTSLWRPSPARAAVAVGLFAIAFTAHALPVAWSAALIGYAWITSRLPERTRMQLTGACVVLLIGARFLSGNALTVQWSVTQFASATGADRARVFDAKYGLVMTGLLLIWAATLARLLYELGPRAVARTIPLHWCALTAAGIAILPGEVYLSAYNNSLAFISERMSLAEGVCVCALLAAVPMGRVQRYAAVIVALLFFVFLFRDERVLNRFEDRVDRAVAGLPRGQRVVSSIVDLEPRINPLIHMIDRACLGRCYSYANYEPSTAQFRIRANGPNPFVVSEYSDSWNLQMGEYAVRPGDAPLYALAVSGSGEIIVRNLGAGAVSRVSEWRVFRDRPLNP